jgi:hypothetical protein
MSFLAGLVRRGAGLPGPVTIRPARSFQEASVSIGAKAAASQVESVAPVHSTRFSPHGSEEGAADAQRLQSSRLVTAVQPDRSGDIIFNRFEASDHKGSIEESSQANVRIMGKNPRRIEIEGTDTKVPMPLVRPHPDEPAASTLRSQQRQSQQDQSTMSVVRQEQVSGAPAKILSRPASPTIVPAAPKQSASPQPQNRDGGAQRSIQVKIGKVEIRSTPVAPPVRAQRKMGTSGFAELGSARSYRDRGGW